MNIRLRPIDIVLIGCQLALSFSAVYLLLKGLGDL